MYQSTKDSRWPRGLSLPALIALLVVWHSHHNGLTARRNVAIACTGLAIFDLLAPDVILPAITF